MRLVFVLALAFFLTLASARAAEKKTFPAPLVDKMLKGWGAIDWGSSLDDFKKKFPDARQLENGRWVSGKGEEDLAGVKVTAEYAFGKKEQMSMVRFQPDADGKKSMRKILIEAGVLREGAKSNWQREGVSFVVAEVSGEQFAILVDAKAGDQAKKKK